MTYLPPPSQPLDVVTVGARGLSGGKALFSRGGWFQGYVLRNTDPANAATVDFYDGGDATGDWIGTWSIPAGSTLVQRPAVGGWPISSGLFADVTTGTVDVSTTLGS